MSAAQANRLVKSAIELNHDIDDPMAAAKSTTVKGGAAKRRAAAETTPG